MQKEAVAGMGIAGIEKAVRGDPELAARIIEAALKEIRKQ